MECRSENRSAGRGEEAFCYWHDPLFLAGCGLYALNRWILKPHFASPFLHNYFNDVWFIPCALPLTLWLQRLLGWRTHDQPPGLGETLFHFLVWAVVAEGIAPHFMRTTGDPWDVAAYAGGTVIGLVWWQRARWLRLVS